EALAGRLGSPPLGAREFPESVEEGGAAPNEECPPASLREDRRHVHSNRRRFSFLYGISQGISAGSGRAISGERATAAHGVSRQTDQLPQVHQPGEPVPRPTGRQQLVDAAVYPLSVRSRSGSPGNRKEPRENPCDVGFGGRSSRAECERGHGRRDIGPESRQRLECRGVAWKSATVPPENPPS